MILSAYISAALALGGAHAFLIPASDPALTEKTISLDCSDCPFALESQKNEGIEWTNDVKSDLSLKFDSDGKSLRLNGVSFYPIEAKAPPQLHVAQVKKEGEDPTYIGSERDLRLSYSLEYEEKKSDDGSSLVSVVMTVLAVDGKMVKVDNVEIRTIKTPDGRLLLHSVRTIQPDPNSLDSKCGNVLCRVFAKVASSLQKAKAKVKTTCYNIKCLCIKCVKSVTGAVKHFHKKPASAPPAPLPAEDDHVRLPTHHRLNPFKIGGRPHHHSHHRKGSFFHRMGHVMLSTVKIAFMPVLIGIAFGMAASAIGMLVGQLVIHLWMKYRKADRVVYIPIDSDEKSGLPAYEDLPVEEVAVEIHPDEKA